MEHETTLNDDPRFKTDKRDLDGQWEQQPALFFEYASKSAMADALVDDVKDEIERFKAQLDPQIRLRLSRAGKFTEAMVAAALNDDERIQAMTETLRKAQLRAALLRASVKALDQRKAALENLVKLHGQEYFAVPITEPSDRAAYNQTKANDQIRKAMTSKKRSTIEQQLTRKAKEKKHART